MTRIRQRGWQDPDEPFRRTFVRNEAGYGWLACFVSAAIFAGGYFAQHAGYLWSWAWIALGSLPLVVFSFARPLIGCMEAFQYNVIRYLNERDRLTRVRLQHERWLAIEADACRIESGRELVVRRERLVEYLLSRPDDASTLLQLKRIDTGIEQAARTARQLDDISNEELTRQVLDYAVLENRNTPIALRAINRGEPTP